MKADVTLSASTKELDEEGEEEEQEDEDPNEPATFRKQLTSLFDRISQLEVQQGSSPEPTPPPRGPSSSNETPSTKPLNRAQRRAAPAPAAAKPVDPMQAEIEALRKQFEKQARIIEEHKAPDPREAELRELKEKIRQQAEVIEGFSKQSASQAQPSQTKSSAPEPKPPSKPEKDGEPTTSNDTVGDEAMEDWISQEAIVMPDGTKAMQYNTC